MNLSLFQALTSSKFGFIIFNVLIVGLLYYYVEDALQFFFFAGGVVVISFFVRRAIDQILGN